MAKNDACDIYCYDEEKVNRIQEELEKEDVAGLAQLFKVLSDENRTKIVYSLCQVEEVCVCDAANIIGSSVATASHHLRALHKQGIVKYRKDGKMAFYSLDDQHIKQLMDLGLAHKKEEKLNA